MKIVVANKTNKQAMDDWEEFLESIRNSTPVDINETTEEKTKRIKRLEADPEEWFKYYFPQFCFAAAAEFQRKSTQRFLKANRIYHSRKWARGLAKSTRRMMEIFFKIFAKKFKANMLLISKSESNAIRLLSPYRANLEANQRLINDYGIQEKPGKWKEEEFITRNKCSFRAVGAEQNPRGAKLDELRVNLVVFDDIDDDEVCRNEERLDNRWQWVEQAVIPTVDISQDYCICFDNNIIAEDSIAVRAAKYADFEETVSIREDGKSVWPEKNSEADIDYIESKLSYESVQKEYYNNPMTQGKTFKEVVFSKCPPLNTLPFVIVYADPATSNKDKPTAKSKAKNSCKAVVVLGCNDYQYFVYKCFVDNVSNSNFIDWLYAAKDYIANATQASTTQPYFFIENNTLQDPFYQQVLLPLIFRIGNERKSKDILPITPDDRQKPDKWFRIEGTLEPINRLGNLIFNEAEFKNPHMERMITQLKSAKPTSKELGGPDALEGGVVKAMEKNAMMKAGGIADGIFLIKRSPNNKRM